MWSVATAPNCACIPISFKSLPSSKAENILGYLQRRHLWKGESLFSVLTYFPSLAVNYQFKTVPANEFYILSPAFCFFISSTDGHKFSGRHWISYSSGSFSGTEILASFGRCASNPFHYGRKNTTAVHCWLVTGDFQYWWNQYWLVAGVQSFLVLRYWVYFSAVRCVLKNPVIQEHRTKWCSCLTCYAFSWSASVVSHWPHCFQRLQLLWLQSLQTG